MRTIAALPIIQDMATNALHQGLGHREGGLEQRHLIQASEGFAGASRLTTREVVALAYGHGLTPATTAALVYGRPPEPELIRGGVRPSKLDRLGASSAWWGEPTARIRDLGRGSAKRLLGAMVGMDLEGAEENDPLLVPVDARFAAFADLEVGHQWQLGLGIHDESWNAGLSAEHRALAPTIIPLLTPVRLREVERERDNYHIVPVPAQCVGSALERHGAGVGVVFHDGRGQNWSLCVHRPRRASEAVGGRTQLEARVSLLDEFWMERRGYTGRDTVWGSSFDEVTKNLLATVPGVSRWQSVALRFPAAAGIKSARSRNGEIALDRALRELPEALWA